jgi:hypothetical protein
MWTINAQSIKAQSMNAQSMMITPNHTAKWGGVQHQPSKNPLCTVWLVVLYIKVLDQQNP